MITPDSWHPRYCFSTMRVRLIASAVVFVLLASIGVSLTLAGRAARDALLLSFGDTWTQAEAASRLERCVADLHRQSTLLAQLYDGDIREGISQDLHHGFTAEVADCENEIEILRSEARFAATLEKATKLLADLREVVSKLGVEHLEAVVLLATQVDPLAEDLGVNDFPQMRAQLSLQLNELQEEIASVGRRGDQTQMIALVGPLLAFTLFTMLLLRRLLGSLRNLMGGMNAFGAGDFSYRVEVVGADEFSAVASRINEMADQLAENQRELSNYSRELEHSLESLQKAQQTAVEQEKLAALGGLVAGIAHEVNTPLGVAVTAASLAKDQLQKLQESAAAGTATRGLVKRFCIEQAEVMEPLENNLSRAAQLIRSFKQVAVDRGTVTTRIVHLDEWAEAVASSLAPTLRTHQVTLELDLPPLELQLAAGELEQILSNLVLNACMHAFEPPGEDESALRVVFVSASADMDRSTLMMTVSDHGAGMEPDVAARVFEPFFTTSRGRGGSGLGMHIVHQLLQERFQGQVELESSPGEGTTWRLTLPMQTKALSLVRGDKPKAVDATPEANRVPTSTQGV